MGENKAFVVMDGERLIDRTLRIFRSLFRETIIVTNSPLDYLDCDAAIVTDIYPGKKALGGVYTGLFYAADPHAFVAACDMPCLNPGFIAGTISTRRCAMSPHRSGWRPEKPMTVSK
jgi:molybdopterin-guanine dinucleotide biosynthesis protein A